MVLCKRRGCGVDFEAGTASAEATCRYHPGAPVFHEGLKSWSCCKDTNKPVMEFEQFMQLPGCATATSHTTETQPLPETAKSVATPASNAADSMAASLQSIKISQPAAPPKPTEPAPPAPEPRDADTVTSVAAGTTCRRPGCGFVAESAITNRDRVSEMCKYHKGTPIFHEGSKGYSCCKPRVLHFDDFLQIKPCTQAEHGHLFTAPAPTEGDRVECRIDHYETPSDVRVTVYAKGVDAEQSVIEIHENEVILSLLLGPTPSVPHTRRFVRTLQPYAPIKPDASSYTLGKMKLDLVLSKQDEGQSWPTLERGEPIYGYGLTFGRR
ncbi:hypothetical protein Malapachy_1754 [Malassezia pachydermatis]|uniref:Chord-domain-containing protein n=1 Tax=Malassezia pachydermatis TaxID=77020 RepID=A0A0M9VNR9_9BASI|nr:hypothetical protein Malapachy_1754 [Malassezia pachydermatis]KOS13633.1 hypothetical protein Malapachy_1754 [Malassezia pachydermatis]